VGGGTRERERDKEERKREKAREGGRDLEGGRERERWSL
jgi:hypothetical protein